VRAQYLEFLADSFDETTAELENIKGDVEMAAQERVDLMDRLICNWVEKGLNEHIGRAPEPKDWAAGFISRDLIPRNRLFEGGLKTGRVSRMCLCLGILNGKCMKITVKLISSW